jgi:twitching motility protein PilT
VLVTGPTGSGKSTTLAAMMDYKNDTEYGHILTIEDPIEFVHQSKKCLINQREVHRDTLGFAEALRSALREDPDIILVGELRDLETIRLAMTAAETGHLVFGTLHTSSAAKTIDRVVDVFPAGEKAMVRSMLSESLRAVISQTLMKRIGGGRVACHEIMTGTPAIRNLIREDKVAQMYSAIQTGQAHGMQTLDQDMQDKLRKGMISKQEAVARAVNNYDRPCELSAGLKAGRKPSTHDAGRFRRGLQRHPGHDGPEEGIRSVHHDGDAAEPEGTWPDPPGLQDAP